MKKLREVKRLAMELPEGDRAALAAGLLDSLPAVLADEDGGVAEAFRRSDELDRDPGAGMTIEELRRSVES